MPLRSLRPCKQVGCPQLTRDSSGYCDEHIHAVNEQQTRYERYRGSARQRGYDSTWERLRKIVLRENPLCHDCLDRDRITPAKEVHHIKKVREHPALRLVKSNLMCLCSQCHKSRTGKGE